HTFGFCNVIFGWDMHDALYRTTSPDPGFADARATVDLTTARNIPWEDNLPFLLADFRRADDWTARVCPRSLLARVVAKAEDRGFQARFGPEYEWFCYRRTPENADHSPTPVTSGMFGYSALRTGQLADFHTDVFAQLANFNVEIEGLHTETGPGALEAAIRHQPALEAADRAVLFKQGIKQIAHHHGLCASFMAKPSDQLPGCGGHLHQSLWTKGRNVFYDVEDEQQLSKTLRQYLAGQLYWLPKLLPLYAPTVNSYKRFVAGSWAATHANWGVDNRTTALRFIPGGMAGTRLELRVPGADANPYLVMAAALASGLYGIEHEL
ncbi:MAG: glutamine synthetase, partial [Bacteroidota bacterium]